MQKNKKWSYRIESSTWRVWLAGGSNFL